MYNEIINCFYECFEFGFLRGKFKSYLVLYFIYVNNIRRGSIFNESRVLGGFTLVYVVGDY